MPDKMLRVDCKYEHFYMNLDIIPKAPYVIYEMSKDLDSFILELKNTGRLKNYKQNCAKKRD